MTRRMFAEAATLVLENGDPTATFAYGGQVD
jgi:hypothetical protein